MRDTWIKKKFHKMLCYKFWFLRLGQICYPTVNGLFRQNKNTPVLPWHYTLPTYLAQSMKHFIGLLSVHISVFIYFVETLVCRYENHLTWLDKSLIICWINPNYHSICWILISQGTGEHFFVYQKHNFLHKFLSKAHKHSIFLTSFEFKFFVYYNRFMDFWN